MSLRSRPSIRVLLTSIAAISTPAHAQSAEAEAMFDQGAKLIAAGKVAEACDAFEASNRIEARAGTLIRLGECRERNHQLASAWSAYKDALTRVKDASKKAIATAKVAELEPKLSTLTITVPEATKVKGLVLTRNGQPVDPGLWNRALPIDGGAYTIVAQSPGHREFRTTATVPESGGKITVLVPTLAEQPAAPVAVPVPVPAARDDSPWTGRREAAVVAAGVGVLALATGVTFAVLAKQKQSDADKLCPAHTCATDADAMTATSRISAAQDRALVANIGFGVAGAAVIAAGVLWFTGAPEHASVAIAPGGATLTVAGRF